MHGLGGGRIGTGHRRIQLCYSNCWLVTNAASAKVQLVTSNLDGLSRLR